MQPHTLTSATATGPAGTVTTSFCYDAAGNMVSRTPSTGTGQTLQWNDQGQVASITQGGSTTSFVYDASGNELIRRDPGQTTLFAGDTEIVVNTAVTPHVLLGATRYYTLGGSGSPNAVRCSMPADPGMWYLFADPLGTATMAMNATSQVLSRQEYTPYGETITSTGWPDATRGYLGKPAEPGTGYADLGARKYDPALGRFISPDPALEAYSPEQLGGYTYAGDNPVAGSDPSGLMICDGDVCGSVQWVSQVETRVYNNQAQAAENQSIDACGYHMGCVMSQVHAYQSPVYKLAQVQNYDAQQEYIAEQEAAQAAAEQRAQAAKAHSGGFWGGFVHAVSDTFNVVSQVVNIVAPIATLVAVATCAIPGVDVITGGIALTLDIASAGINSVKAGQAFASGRPLDGALDVAGAVLSIAAPASAAGRSELPWMQRRQRARLPPRRRLSRRRGGRGLSARLLPRMRRTTGAHSSPPVQRGGPTKSRKGWKCGGATAMASWAARACPSRA